MLSGVCIGIAPMLAQTPCHAASAQHALKLTGQCRDSRKYRLRLSEDTLWHCFAGTCKPFDCTCRSHAFAAAAAYSISAFWQKPECITGTGLLPKATTEEICSDGVTQDLCSFLIKTALAGCQLQKLIVTCLSKPSEPA